MTNYRGTVIAPIVSVIALLIGAGFNITFPTDVIDQVVSGIVAIVTSVVAIHGIFKNHKKTPLE